MDRKTAIDWLESIRHDVHGGDEEYDRRRKEALDMAITDMKNCETSNADWISIKDGLPAKYTPFYAACKSLVDDRENWTIEGIYNGTIYGGPWGVPMVEMGKAEVYAWMPKEMPKPPKDDFPCEGKALETPAAYPADLMEHRYSGLISED